MRLVTVKADAPIVRKQRRLGRKFFVILAVIIVLLGFNYLRPLPAATVTIQLPDIPKPNTVSLAWPSQGHAAVAVDGYGLVGVDRDSAPLATASIAKVIVALCVLEKHPLEPGQTGPQLTMTQADLELYNAEIERNGSRLPVYVGETLSEYELLQALLLPSANNIANTLAIWAFGSIEKYSAYANEFVQRHGLTQTRIGRDASGYDASTVSTAQNLASLGQLALKNPVLKDIASQKSAVLPFAGTVYNYNTALGVHGINGLKTGNNLENPGALLFTASVPVENRTVDVSGAVLGAVDLDTALRQSETLVASITQNFETVSYLQKGQTIGVAKTKWGAEAKLVTSRQLSVTRWTNHALTQQHTVRDISSGSEGQIGSVQIKTDMQEASVSVVLDKPVAHPSLWWRLTRL